MAPKMVGAANLRNAEGDPCGVDLAGERINSEYTKNRFHSQQVSDNVTLDFLRRRFVRRKVHCGPELEAFLVKMAFEEGRP